MQTRFTKPRQYSSEEQENITATVIGKTGHQRRNNPYATSNTKYSKATVAMNQVSEENESGDEADNECCLKYSQIYVRLICVEILLNKVVNLIDGSWDDASIQKVQQIHKGGQTEQEVRLQIPRSYCHS